MNWKENVLALKNQLESLGFAGGLEGELTARLCFGPDRFTIQHKFVKDADVLMIDLLIQQEKGGNYVCRQYDVCLQKTVEIDPDVADERVLLELLHDMSVIDWGRINDATFLTIAIGDKIQSITRRLSELDGIALKPELSDLIRFKFWRGTPAERYATNLSGVRRQFEVTQRFYFFPGEPYIAIDDAYRFLNHKWLERQMQKVRKVTTEVSGEMTVEKRRSGKK